MVHQHFMLVKTMTVLQNIVLGLRETGYPFYKKKDTEIRVRSLIDQYGLRLDLDKEINELSVGIQQRVEIVKALYRQAKLLILDEPTAVLTPQETEEFFGILKTLKERGHSIILISHNLSDIMSVSDRVTVLRDGRTVFQEMCIRDRHCSKSELRSRRGTGCSTGRQSGRKGAAGCFAPPCQVIGHIRFPDPADIWLHQAFFVPDAVAAVPPEAVPLFRFHARTFQLLGFASGREVA